MKKLLLCMVALVSMQMIKSSEALIKATKEKNLEEMQILIRLKANIDTVSKENGWTPIIYASRGANIEVVRLLIKSKANVNFQTSQGDMALHESISLDGNSIVELLLLAGADPNQVQIKPREEGCRGLGEAPLTCAIYLLSELIFEEEYLFYKDLDILQLLIKFKSDPNQPDQMGHSPLVCAREYLNFFCLGDVMQLLVQAKASLDKDDLDRNQESAMFFEAIKMGHANLARLLISKKVNIEAVIAEGGISGYTCLNYAANRGRIGIVEMLIRAKADLERANLNGTTPLNSATNRGHLDVVEALLRAKVDTDQENNFRVSPILCSAYKGGVDLMKVLIQSKAEVDKDAGNTPLYFAAYKGFEDITQLLIEADADVHKVSDDGSTAIQIAAQYDHSNVVRLLLQAGAVLDSDDFKDGNELKKKSCSS